MFAIPVFIILIGIEAVAAGRMGIKVNRPADMISSLSSGATNTVRDGINFGFILISYTWFVDKLTLYKLEPVWLAVITGARSVTVAVMVMVSVLEPSVTERMTVQVLALLPAPQPAAS